MSDTLDNNDPAPDGPDATNIAKLTSTPDSHHRGHWRWFGRFSARFQALRRPWLGLIGALSLLAILFGLLQDVPATLRDLGLLSSAPEANSATAASEFPSPKPNETKEALATQDLDTTPSRPQSEARPTTFSAESSLSLKRHPKEEKTRVPPLSPRQPSESQTVADSGKPQFPLEFSLEDSEQRILLGGQVSLGINFNIVEGFDLVTLTVITSNSQPTRYPFQSSGERVKFELESSSYYVYIQKIDWSARTVELVLLKRPTP